MINNKQEALNEIQNLSNKFDIKIYEIKSLLRDSNKKLKDKTNLTQIFLSYMSGIFIFAGICIYISMMWKDLNQTAKVIITLGSGVTAYIISISSVNNFNYKHIAAPLLLISAFLEPLGLNVIIYSYLPSITSTIIPVIIIAAIMLLQYLLTFIKYKTHTALFLAIFFGSGLFIALSNYLNISDDIAGLTLGVSLLLISYSLKDTIYKNIAPIWYFCSAVILFTAYFDIVHNTIFELSFLLIVILMIFVSISAQSRTLLFTSATSLIGFLGYYSAKYFANSFGWPIILIVIGIIFFVISGYLIRFSKNFN